MCSECLVLRRVIAKHLSRADLCRFSAERSETRSARSMWQRFADFHVSRVRQLMARLSHEPAPALSTDPRRA